MQRQVYKALCSSWSRGCESLWNCFAAIVSALSFRIEQAVTAAVDIFCQAWSGWTEGEVYEACTKRSRFCLVALACSSCSVVMVGGWIKVLGTYRERL